MRTNAYAAKGFTVLELLVVVTVIAILAALLFPVLSRVKDRGKRITCLNNLTQIAKGVHMYADDSNQILFPITNPSEPFFSALAFYQWTAYDALMRNYVGLKGTPSPQDKLFACPADTFYYGGTNGAYVLIPQSEHLQSKSSYSSYAFNAGNAVFRIPNPAFPGMFPGIMGRKLSSIEIPAKTAWFGIPGHGWLLLASTFASRGRLLQQCSEHVELRGRPCQLRQNVLWLEQPLATLPAPICLQPACRI